REGAPWVTAVFQDITEGKQIERTARRAERLEAVAELAASLAHEIKNPLASIRSAVEQLAGDRLDHRDRGVLRRLVVAESNRLSVLLADFMEFSRLELRRSRSVDLAELVMDAIGVVSQHPDAGEGQRIEFDRPAEPVSVGGDRDVLHRALFNLLLNGVQHVGQGGVVRVELAPVGEADLPAGMEVGAGAKLVVSDTGPGIRDEDVPRLFDPFFTTRDGGTGLGLALVHRAVEAHRGAILVDGMPGVGARFTVFLPNQGNGSRS
ncbi:MAG TPA: ATP-binding protein, partial [Thermoanaerobaculia bacterium]|nr:ATP-binding protein [Thermoanaerobaculia bacterium]